MTNRIVKKIEITGAIILRTGLHIGGTNSSMSIGGIDKGVIRNPITNEPYVPGSSLKGKMRSLLEVSIGANLSKINEQVVNGPAKTGIASILFGNATGQEDQKPSRLIVRDSILLDAQELLSKTDIPFTEGKTEVVIDRITSKASPRQIERVPAGAKFSFNMVLNIWDNDDKNINLLDTVFKCLELLKDDYLGGSGSRGYGQLAFDITDILEKSTETYYGNLEAKPVSLKAKYTDYINKLKE
jgi:CRISPR-associated protein Csm3